MSTKEEKKSIWSFRITGIVLLVALVLVVFNINTEVPLSEAPEIDRKFDPVPLAQSMTVNITGAEVFVPYMEEWVEVPTISTVWDSESKEWVDAEISIDVWFGLDMIHDAKTGEVVYMAAYNPDWRDGLVIWIPLGDFQAKKAAESHTLG